MEPINNAHFFDILLKAQKHYGKHLEPVCKQKKLTRNEMDVLLFLHNNPGFDRAADIVNFRGIAKSHVSLAVSQLEARGILARRYDPSDHRACHLALTGKGMDIAEAGSQRQRQFFEALYAGVTPEERELMRSVTRKIMDNVAAFECETAK